MIATPTIVTTRLTIRAFQIDDLAAFAAYRADPVIAQYQSWDDYQLEDAKALFNSMDYALFGAAGNWFQLAIVDKIQQLVGDVAVHFVDDMQMELGFTIARQYQQQGFATEAVAAVIDYLFVSLNKHRITAITDAENLASMALLERLGFRKEAHYLKNIFFKGKWSDECGFALLQQEYFQQS
ncbi:GNAT family N-acetyltransferase [Shewanella sp. UCD-KL21]|uniref:GNAT family N-acetyltransferase n=1 Tax=Shewanella sp. UCD-KL21 TaxID=1917164 RepID=UPI0009705B91|nr:GNAT family protein [Shewanella sp. UCD-KL21]